MDGKRVRELEEEIEAAIAKVVRRLGKDHNPPLPERVCHLMAKAAVAVFEAVDEQPQRRA
ncbi:MAG: hypothetical protein ACLQNE_30075 [Thermoguttaceae bacterium]